MAKTVNNVKITTTFTTAASREQLTSGENLCTSLGKINKYLADLDTGAFAFPADGGNAETVDGKHADDFALAENNFLDDFFSSKSGDIRALVIDLPSGGFGGNTGRLPNITGFPIAGDIIITWFKSVYSNGLRYGTLQVRSMTQSNLPVYQCSVYNDGVYTDWQKLCDGGMADAAREIVSPNSKAKLWEDSEGGNLRLVSPDGNHSVEMDLHNNAGFRMYFTDNGELTFPVDYNSTTKKFNINGNADTVDELHGSDLARITDIIGGLRRGWATSNTGVIMKYADREVVKTSNDLSYVGWTNNSDGWFTPIIVSQASRGTSYTMWGQNCGYDYLPASEPRDGALITYKGRKYYACWQNPGSTTNPNVVGGVHVELTDGDFVKACKTLIDLCENIDAATLETHPASDFLYANGFAGQLAKLFSQPANDNELATLFSVVPDDATLNDLNPGVYVVNTSAARKSLGVPDEIQLSGPSASISEDTMLRPGGILIKFGSILGNPGYSTYVSAPEAIVPSPFMKSCAFFISNDGSLYRAKSIIQAIIQNNDQGQSTGYKSKTRWAWQALVFENYSNYTQFTIQDIKYFSSEVVIAPGSYYLMYVTKARYNLPYKSGTAYGPTKSYPLVLHYDGLCIKNSDSENLILPAGQYLIRLR